MIFFFFSRLVYPYIFSIVMSCPFMNKWRYIHSDSSEAEADLAGRCPSGPRGVDLGHRPFLSLPLFKIRYKPEEGC